MKSLHVLIVEDNPADVEMMRICSSTSDIPISISVITDGESALSYLHRIEGHDTTERPDLIILDLNLPRKDGLTVLKEIKNNDSLCDIPVIIMSTSDDEEDIRNCYIAQALAFITKPSDLAGFENACKQILNLVCPKQR